MNKVTLLGFYGGDITHAQSAWTSTDRKLTDEKLNRVDKLLSSLASNGHGTPFEKSFLHFMVEADQASHIHLLKHRIGVSINVESARYKELQEDKYIIPAEFEQLKVSSKNKDLIDSLISIVSDNKELTWADVLYSYSCKTNLLYHKFLEDAKDELTRPRAKEIGRYFKMFNSTVTMDISFNFRSFVNFLELRTKPNAQKEIQDIAKEMLNLVKQIPDNPFQHSLKAFNL